MLAMRVDMQGLAQRGAHLPIDNAMNFETFDAKWVTSPHSQPI